MIEKLLALIEADAISAAVAGAAGGLVRWMTLRENWKEGLASLVVGAIAAVYIGPLAAPVLEPFIGEITKNTDGLASFVVGLSGISLTGLILDIIKTRAAIVKKEADNG